MPRLSLEHLATVPFEMTGLRLPVGVLRRPDRLAVVGQQRFLKPCRAVRLIGDEQGVIHECEHAQIKYLVVKDAQSQSVAFVIRSAELMPADVSCVESDGDAPQPHVEPADRTAILVCPEHTLSKLRVTLSLCGDGLQRQVYGVQNVLVKRLREVSFKNLISDLGDEGRFRG